MTSPSPDPDPAADERRRGPRLGEPSPRVRLAQLARETALATPGVVELDSGPTGTAATVGGGTRVAGVTCAVAPDGGYDVSLRLVCALVDLPALAQRVRAAIGEAAAAVAGPRPSTISIEIVDVVDVVRGTGV